MATQPLPSPPPLQYDALPAELKDRPQWVAWQYEARDGKPTKVLLNPRTGRRAKSTDPATWGTFEEARVTVDKRDGERGIGFVFTRDDPYVGVDLDGCYDPLTGFLTPAARAIVAAFATYTEISPSGTGLHLIVRATLPPGARNRRGKIECYATGRYFTMTGDRLPDTPHGIAEGQAALEVFAARHLSRAIPAARAALTVPVPDETTIINRAKQGKNGATFARLWAGDLAGHPSQSEADLALVSMLAFYAGPDEALIDRLFRQSRLYRDKWERDDYRARTIRAALDGRTEFYSWPRPRRATAALLAPVPANVRPIRAGAGPDHQAPFVAIEPISNSTWVFATDAAGETWLCEPRKSDYLPVVECPAPRVLRLIQFPEAEMPGGRRTWYEIAFAGEIVMVPREEVQKGDVWERFGAYDFAGKRTFDNLSKAIHHLARKPDVQRQIGSRTAGWHTDQEEHFFVLPDGTIIRAAGRSTDSPIFLPALDDKHIRPYRSLDLRAAVNAQRDALAWLGDATQASVGPLVLCAAIRSLLYGVLPSDASLLLIGPTQTGKTSIASWMRNLTGDFTGWPLPPATATFDDTVASIEDAVSRLASYPLLIDDLTIKPGATDSETRETAKKAEMLLRSVGNASPVRERMTRTMDRQVARYIHGFPIITGERLPPALPSLLARSLVLQIAYGTINVATLRTGADRHAAGLRAFGHGFLAWIAGRLDRKGDTFVAALERLHRQYQAVVADRLKDVLGREIPGEAERLSSNAAHLLLAAQMMATYTKASGWETPITPLSILDDLIAHLVRQVDMLTGDAAGTLSHASLREWGAEVIRDALAAGKAYVKRRDGSVPDDERWPCEWLGYRERVAGEKSWEARGLFAGNIITVGDQPALALDPHGLYTLLRRAARDDKRHTFPETAQVLWPQLRDTGLLVPDSTGTSTMRVRFDGARDRRVVIPLAVLRPDDDDPDAEPDAGPDSDPPLSPEVLDFASAAPERDEQTEGVMLDPLTEDAQSNHPSTPSIALPQPADRASRFAPADMLSAWAAHVVAGNEPGTTLETARRWAQRCGIWFDVFESVPSFARRVLQSLPQGDHGCSDTGPAVSTLAGPSSDGAESQPARAPKMRRGFRYLPTAYVDPHTGTGVADAEEEGATPLPVTIPPAAPLGIILGNLPPHIERLFLCGERPGDGTAAGMYRWFRAGMRDGWEHGRMFVDADYPVLRLRHQATQRTVDVRRAAIWFGEGAYTPRAAYDATQVLRDELRRQQAFSGTRLLTTPGMTGLDLWDRTHSTDQYPPLPDDLQALIAGTSGQGRIELCTPSELERVPNFSYLDGRFMYAALTTELGVGPVQRDEQDAFAGYQPGRYRVRVIVPTDWDHLGLLPFPARDTDGDPIWDYPAQPGAIFETWVDGAELHLARARGWQVTILERILLTKPTKGTPDPLEVWTRNLVAIRQRVEARTAAGDYPEGIGELVADAVRNILLHGIGAFASQGRPETVIIPDGEPLPDEALSRRFHDGMWFCNVPVRLSAWTQGHRHPEWSATVWARARRRLLHHRMRIGNDSLLTGALALPRADVLALRTDALYVANDPRWPDPGRNGVFRLKGAIAESVPAPHDWTALNALRDRAEAAYRQKGGS